MNMDCNREIIFHKHQHPGTFSLLLTLCSFSFFFFRKYLAFSHLNSGSKWPTDDLHQLCLQPPLDMRICVWFSNNGEPVLACAEMCGPLAERSRLLQVPEAP